MVLAIFGSGPIRGFAITLVIGITASFLTAVFLTRLLYENRMAKGKWLHLTFDTRFSRFMFRLPLQVHREQQVGTHGHRRFYPHLYHLAFHAGTGPIDFTGDATTLSVRSTR